MTDIPAMRAWELAEQRCFDFLKESLGSFEDVDAYLAEFPAHFTNETNSRMWAFEINGPGELGIISIQQSARVLCSWEMGAMLKGIFDNRTLAQQIAGKIMTVMPIDNGELKGITRFEMTAMPTINRGEIQSSNDQSAGGLKRIWTLTIPFRVVFNNQKS